VMIGAIALVQALSNSFWRLNEALETKDVE